MEARRLIIDNKLLLIYDNINLEEIYDLETYVKNIASFKSTQSDSKESLNDVGSYWASYIDKEKFKNSDFFSKLSTIYADEFKLTCVDIDVSYINSFQYGDNPYVHKDANHIHYSDKNTTVTSILYLNKDWEENWQGETMFYDQEIAYAVLPKYGRLVIFDGDISHAARPPSRLCFKKRINHVVKAVGIK
jgi:Rps23 Pro-64 3,4-dihydroxylase Tpa1-like proline 4-hydroxylase